MKSLASDDPDRNRPLDFYHKDDNERTLGNSTRSVSTQSDQVEDDDWVIIDSPTRDVSTQTDQQLMTFSRENEMQKHMNRALSYEIQQAELRYLNLRDSYDSAKGRYELMLKSQRLTMEGKIDLLEIELKAQKAESNRKMSYFTRCVTLF